MAKKTDWNEMSREERASWTRAEASSALSLIDVADSAEEAAGYSRDAKLLLAHSEAIERGERDDQIFLNDMVLAETSEDAKPAGELKRIDGMIEFLEQWIAMCRDDRLPYDGASDAAGPPTTMEMAAGCLKEHSAGHPDDDDSCWSEEFCPFCELAEEGAEQERERVASALELIEE